MADIIDTLNDLIATCRDSEEGKAAKGVHSDDLRAASHASRGNGPTSRTNRPAA